MKKLVQINVVCNGSTGKIMCDIAKEVKKEGYDTYCFYGRGKPNSDVNCMKIGNKLSAYFHVLLARLGFNGHGSYFATKKMVRQLKKINPDIIHLHNIHGYYLNLKVLFNYLKNKYKGKIVWTLHDCWTFTGHCSHFTVAKCNKWETGCKNCPQLECYPKEYFDTTSREFNLKKRLFTGMEDLTIVTPSVWLAELAKKSFLQKYPIQVINNGINLSIFKHSTEEKIYKKYGIPKDKKIILGVASIWGERKGIKDFIQLSKTIDSSFVIVLVGIDQSTKKSLPDNIITITRTENQIELANLYSIATVFFNPTYEDNYPTTNLESMACGTPVICYNTGGCCEQLEMLDNGMIISNSEISKLLNIVDKLSEQKNVIKKCDVISVEYMVNEYAKLYKTKGGKK